MKKATLAALKEVKGTYGIAVEYVPEPDKIIAARMGSPVVIGLGEHERFIASDAAPILKHTSKVVFLEDGEIAVITPEKHDIFKLDGGRVERDAEKIRIGNLEAAQRGGYQHFMLKEIMEGPEVVQNTLRGRLLEKEGLAKLGGLESVADEIKRKQSE